MNMKKKLMISGTTLVAAMTLGTVATAHAATYDEMEAKWEKIAPIHWCNLFPFGLHFIISSSMSCRNCS